MRASCSTERVVKRAAESDAVARFGALEAAILTVSCAIALPVSAQAGVSPLDPAFRLAAGGLAIAGPVIDSSSTPAAWLISEDLSLYALTEKGGLAARISLPDQPLPFIALDPFGRVIVDMGGGTLAAYTKIGALAWQAAVDPVAGAAADYPPAFGPDGRAFVLSGQNLICLNPSGLRLWSLPLTAFPSCAPAVDGSGRPCIGLTDGSLLIATAYGEPAVKAALGSALTLLFPLGSSTGGGEGPRLAASLSDGRLLLLGSDAAVKGVYRSKAAVLALAADGNALYGLDASGEAFALAADGKPLWSVSTGCRKGGLYLFADRLVAVGQGRAVSLSLAGDTFRELTIPGASGAPAISPAGLAFSSGSDWVLAAYRFERPLGPRRLPLIAPYAALADSADEILAYDPFASDPDEQLTRLADIEKSLRSGTIGKDERAAAEFCAAVVTRTLERDLSQEQRRFGGNPLARERACYLLGSLGSPGYREPLFRAIESDVDPAVRAAACEALGLFGVDPDGASMAAFMNAAARPVDERSALAIIASIEGLTLRSGRGLREGGLRALVDFAASPYTRAVRDRAEAALARIAGAEN